MQGQQPGEQRQRQGRRDQQQRRPAALEDQPGEVAANDLSDGREHEQQGGPNHGKRSGMDPC